MKHLIVGTAGHIDHGKSALVQALTGIDPDRLEEEKKRGITIDLGFAHLDLGGDLRVGFVEVPGHERFVKNMRPASAELILYCWWWLPTNPLSPRRASILISAGCSASRRASWSSLNATLWTAT